MENACVRIERGKWRVDAGKRKKSFVGYFDSKEKAEHVAQVVALGYKVDLVHLVALVDALWRGKKIKERELSHG